MHGKPNLNQGGFQQQKTTVDATPFSKGCSLDGITKNWGIEDWKNVAWFDEFDFH